MRLTKILAVCIGLFAAQQSAGQYCIPAPGALAACGTSGLSVRINSVSTSGAASNISNNNNTCSGYTHYTGTGNRVIAQAGTNISLTVNTEPASSANPAQYPYRIVIWIDWNHDGAFDNTAYNPLTMVGERMVVSPNTGYTYGNYTATIPVPLNAEDGTTRMRIRAGTRNSSSPPYVPPNIATGIDPCAASDFAFGEVEDYDFYAVNPCTEPQKINYNNLTAHSVTIKWNKRHNADKYEYLVTTTPAVPDPGTGNYLTTDTVINLPDANTAIQCGKRHYVYVRSVCDTNGAQINWKYSPWKMDYFDAPLCCHAPTAIASDVKSTSAIMSWMFIPSFVQYEYAVRVDTNTPASGNIINTNRIALQGLIPGTQLYFFVRTHCSPTPLSAWSMTPFLTQPPTSIDAINNNELIQVYPNPAVDKVTIAIAAGMRSGIGMVEVTDITGKVLVRTKMGKDSLDIDLTGKPSGIYLIRYRDDKNNSMVKLHKE